MRLIKTIIAIIFVVTIFNAIGFGQVDFNDISAYYGFGEIEIVKLNWGINGLRIADFDGDSRNDIAVVNNRKARIELLIQKPAVGSAKTAAALDAEDVDINDIFGDTPTRFDKQSVAVSQKIFSFACGDLNSDAMTDLAFYGEPKGLYVILQKTTDDALESADSLSWQERKKIDIDDGLLTLNSMVCADLNNDGLADLALAARNKVYIILQKKDGSLAEPVKYPVTEQIFGIEARDLNGDGINDLILITNDKEKPVNVRFGLASGQLGPQIQFFIEKPYAMDFCNIDSQTGDEMLTIDSISWRLSCYKIASENRDNADWPTFFYPLESGDGSLKRDLRLGDFDGDGLSDVVISEPAAAELVFYKQLPGSGLAEPKKFPAFSDIESLSVADIDGDKKAEVVVLSVKEKVIGISEFENDRFLFPKPIDLIGEPLAMETADVDSDGKVDCLYVSKDANDNRFMRVIYNFAAVDDKKAKKTPAFVLELEGFSSNPDGLKIVDVDQDGLKDVLVFDNYNPPAMLIRQIKPGEFEVIDSSQSQASLIKDASRSSIAIADVDNLAGDELLIAQNNFARSLVFSDSRIWTVVDQYNAKGVENRVSAVAAFALDGENPNEQPAILLLDGQKGQLQILKIGEDKTYRLEKELDVGKWNTAAHLKMLFASLTGSKAKSILLFDGEKFAIVTPPDAESVPQRLEKQFNYETELKNGGYGNFAAGDINSDGKPDIVMVEYRRNYFEILALDSQMKPVPAMRFKIFEQKSYRDKKNNHTNVEPHELKIADVTGDGKNDLVTLIHDRIIIYPQD